MTGIYNVRNAEGCRRRGGLSTGNSYCHWHCIYLRSDPDEYVCTKNKKVRK